MSLEVVKCDYCGRRMFVSSNRLDSKMNKLSFEVYACSRKSCKRARF